MTKTHRLLILVVAVLQSVLLHAQDPYYTTISLSDGLPSNTVYDVLQDSKGFMWLATAEGLCRYDGFECITYSGPDQTSKAGGSLKEDKYGRIWYENFDGYLYYLQNDTLHGLPEQKKPTGYVGFAILGNRVIATHINAIDYYDLKTLKHITSEKLDNDFISNAISTNTDYYVATTNLYNVKYNAATETYNLLTTPFKSEHAIGRICLTDKGVLCYNQLKEQRIAFEITGEGVVTKFNIPYINFIHIIKYVGGYYWVCTPAGVYGVDTSGNYINNGKPFFTDKNILGVYKDREGNFWFQTSADGILLVPDINTRMWQLGGLRPNSIFVQGNSAFVGTQAGQVLRTNLPDFSYSTIFSYGGGHDISNLYVDTISKRIFTSSSMFKELDYAGKTISESVTAVKDIERIDDKYYAYAASGVAGLIFNSGSKSTLKSIWDSLHNSKLNNNYWATSSMLKEGVRAKSVAHIEGTDKIFFSTNLGLLLLTPKGMSEVKYQNKSLFILSLQRYKNKIFGLNTNGAIYTINARGEISTFNFSENTPISVNRIKVVKNFLFLFAGKQLFYVDLDNNNYNAQKIYNSIWANEISDIEVWNDKLVFALQRGLIMVNFRAKYQPLTTNFVVNHFKINKYTFDISKPISVAHTQNDIEINYSLLSFNPGSTATLYYSINNDDWKAAPANSRTLKLASLSPDNYVIRFKLGEIQLPQTIQFTIKKPLWLQWWFWAAVFVVCLLTAFIYYRWKLSIHRKENKRAVEKIELEKNLRQSMLTSIKSQMNPHFFYNALNTIQSYIFTDDKRNASSYLAKFSKLTRMILEMSEKDTVSLTEEVDALILYLELEKARFNEDDFNFSIVVDSSLDLDIVKIPSMIVQPYVENAIKHGLLHKKGKKKLTVDFYVDGNNLCISVDDNGIGRKKSGELAKIKSDKHKPFATMANLKRIEILNKGNNKIGVEYNDKADFSGIATGTTVHITIPVNHENTLYNESTYQSHNN